MPNVKYVDIPRDILEKTDSFCSVDEDCGFVSDSDLRAVQTLNEITRRPFTIVGNTVHLAPRGDGLSDSENMQAAIDYMAANSDRIKHLSLAAGTFRPMTTVDGTKLPNGKGLSIKGAGEDKTVIEGGISMETKKK